jgi:hypothetical protein
MEVSMNNKAKAKRIIKVYYECIGVNTEYTINYIAAELDRIDREERTPMTDSALVQEVRQAIKSMGEVHFPSSATINLITSASRLCDEFDAAIKRALTAETTIHELTKKLEKYENGI